MQTAVMVAEIKNFYDSGMPNGDRFTNEQSINERHASVSNRFLEIMSKTVHKYGGDVI